MVQDIYNHRQDYLNRRDQIQVVVAKCRQSLHEMTPIA
jgi:hypothetical protein